MLNLIRGLLTHIVSIDLNNVHVHKRSSDLFYFLFFAVDDENDLKQNKKT